MADAAVSAQLQQWTFEKPTAVVTPDRSGSAASSPDLYNNDETLRIDAAAVDASSNRDPSECPSLHERYLSSEEDLSPMEEADSDSEYEYHDGEDAEIVDIQKQPLSARNLPIARIGIEKRCGLAVTVSYASVGRPKVIDLVTAASPIVRDTTQRSASLAQLPIAAINKLQIAEQPVRHSFVPTTATTHSSRSTSPATSSRRPSIGHAPFSHNSSALRITDSSSSSTSSLTGSSAPSTSPALADESYRRPVTAAPRSSLYITSTASASPVFPPLSPQSPAPHAFLSSDPYENVTTSAASPIIKETTHKRLRSISMKLSLAKIAITPSTKKWDSRINGRPGQMPPTPSTPFSPTTPMTAPATGSFSSPKTRLRRASRISRPTSIRGPSPELPPLPTPTRQDSPRKSVQRLVPRGADEREPMLELPPFPDDDSPATDPMGSLNGKRLRKRKSLMDLL